MTVVRRFTQDSGGRRRPAVPAELLTLMDELAGPPDFWDRPDGDFGPLTDLYELDVEARQRANSLYRLGSKALDRDELSTAADWLGSAAAAGHPGALFRLALVALLSGKDWKDEAWFLVAEAARHGHGDAERLLAASAGRRPSPTGTAPLIEDMDFFEDVRRLLGVAPSLLEPAPPSASPVPSRRPDAGGICPEAHTGRPTATPELVLVPAPVVPTSYRPVPHPDDTPRRQRRRLTALPGGLSLSVPDLQPPPAAAVYAPVRPGGEPWWSASALRPALLTDLARTSATPAVVPARWQATRRARDMLLLIHDSDGIDTRTLTRRTHMPFNHVVRLLDWLRDEQFIETRAGAHFPGPLMHLATTADRDHTLLRRCLAELRDQLGAAVYISTYANGEIAIRESASSASAPPVQERAPFTDTGHASAVGKSLLAQLNFADRMDHLTRYPSVQLTGRTITDTRRLFEQLDGPGPHSAQFDLLEYSDTELCVAFSLGLPGRASAIALSLPATEHQRLIDTARLLSQRATGLLLAHLLTEDMHRADPQPERQAWSQPSAARRALP
ncbi:IclR family transcriptional regulator C-terminal domain-containing protein [Streptomyces sp. NPDC127063]|uniref:IclR family transcriptional regulator domain-containing protein n=1 Tax=Streptomyces sp. NPDC127063 TaxID=3347123 RepID=UPI00365A93BB